MSHLCILLIVALVATSCASAPKKEEMVLADGATGPTIDFLNSGSFDQKVSAAMRAKPQTVTVNLLAPATLNELPDRLGSWLNMVEKSHGKVQLQDDSKVQTRALFDPISMLLSGIGLYRMYQERAMYSPVSAYNATVHYEGKGNVSKVVFTRKE
jgi:hypothetical protein